MATSKDSLSSLTACIASGLNAQAEGDDTPRELLGALFGERYHQKHASDAIIRNAIAKSRSSANANDSGGGVKVPYAGLIAPENQTSGAYGGSSFVWFPSEGGSLVALVVGTNGLAPDEHILLGPGHRRRVGALRTLLTNRGASVWAKSDPAAIGQSVPQSVLNQFSEHATALKRYTQQLYLIAEVGSDATLDDARFIVRSILDLYAYERGWSPYAKYEKESNELLSDLTQSYFETPTIDHINDLLRARRFVILHGPPGTGKTRLANKLLEENFGGNGMTVQFHPSITYEDFVVGLAPKPADDGLAFNVREGFLAQANQRAKDGPFLLAIDEINRADLGRVLGEAIYLFEVGETGNRKISLNHPVGDSKEFQLSENLFILGTMNTADRSIARMDLAVRRRFAFVPVPPSPEPVIDQGIELATSFFQELQMAFLNFASDEAFQLMPGHAYFLAESEEALRNKLRYEVIPLLDEYIEMGVLGAAQNEVQAIRDRMKDAVEQES